MKTCIRPIVTFFLLMSFLITKAQTPIPKLTDRSKKGILAYFKTIVANKQVIVGQQCSQSPDVALEYQKNFQRLYDSTGHYPALLGLDYGYFPNINFAQTNEYAINHWKKGGLVTLSWHADCPFTEGYNVRLNTVENKSIIDLKKLLKNAPDSKEKASYRAELANVAKALKQLKNAGLTVLWRPFHEMNGTWFWWGTNDIKNPTNQKDYAALWMDMYQTFTKDYGLDNLIWIYAPNIAGTYFPAPDVFYPGDKYVDIVALDNYPKVPAFEDYPSLLKMGKIVSDGEVGPDDSAFGHFDETAVLNTFKGKAPYFLQWHSWQGAKVAIVDNLNAKALMDDASAITLDKIR
ncbi:glycosyl hydrolase [Mucilaginibacter sp. dw_454]|uniref:glycosyl hydrolase n=1 Tax=Mucilaginibacter sp. dw_454 TaxID=2720079 RepID=UPI001BD69FF4|nr:glycosyl hydrolase [Mucilaginibacter sp. dw_454]